MYIFYIFIRSIHYLMVWFFFSTNNIVIPSIPVKLVKITDYVYLLIKHIFFSVIFVLQ